MNIRIQLLEQRYIAELAAWHHAEWHHLDSSYDEATRRDELAAHCETTRLPATFIALEGDVLVGGICLVAEEVSDRAQYSPWISRIYVSPQHRGKAIGQALIEHVKEELRRQGYLELYLLTEDKGPYYARMGWAKMEDYQLNGHAVEIMKSVLY